MPRNRAGCLQITPMIPGSEATPTSGLLHEPARRLAWPVLDDGLFIDEVSAPTSRTWKRLDEVPEWGRVARLGVRAHGDARGGGKITRSLHLHDFHDERQISCKACFKRCAR